MPATIQNKQKIKLRLVCPITYRRYGTGATFSIDDIALMTTTVNNLHICLKRYYVSKLADYLDSQNINSEKFSKSYFGILSSNSLNKNGKVFLETTIKEIAEHYNSIVEEQINSHKG